MVKEGLMKKLLVLSLVFACMTGNAQVSVDSVVMTVAGKQIPLDEFIFIAQKNSEVNLSDRKSVNAYVELFKNFKLKVAEAEDLGLDKTKAFKDELDSYRAQLTSSYLSDKDGEEAAVRAVYDRYGEVLELSHILFRLPQRTLSKDTVPVYQKAIEAYERIQAGEDFAAVGKELKDDPEYQRRLAAGEISGDGYHTTEVASHGKALTSVILFLAATIGIVLFGSIDGLRPTFTTAQGEVQMEMSHIIEVLMLSAASLILLFTKTDGIKAAKGSVFNAGMQAVVAIFGIAWMGDTFIAGNMEVMKENIFGLVTDMPWLFGVALFLMSILLFSQAATVRSLLPLGIALGISPYMLIALFPAVNGYFFLPNYPTVIAAINFDTTGTTRIGKYLLNHSFMMPGLIATIVSVVLGIVWVSMM